MQHLEEGTIHAWLDGALTADEAARVDEHVKDCPQCQAAVAEARGFIAASSRILTALDNAPRGVIPVAAPKKRVQPWVWRIAATALVVAGGTLLLTRPSRTGKLASKVASESVPPSAMDATTATLSQSATEPAANAQREGSQNVATAPVVGATAPALAQRRGAIAPAPTAAPARAPAENDFSGRAAAGGARLDERREVATAKTSVETAPSSAALPNMNVRSFGLATGTTFGKPREVETKRVASGMQTFYEVAPGDTVILEEQAGGELQNIAATGAAPAPTSRRAQPTAMSAKSATVTQSQQKVEAAAAAPPPPAPPLAAAMQDAQAGEMHRISWLDPSSGRVLILSGRHSQDDLQAIRKRIQQLRDAAGQSKKLPD